jgi:UDP-N-acetylglucosamine 2-epimerase (non-hydrolysing)
MSTQHNSGRRVAVIYGTRPEAIKMAPVVSGLQKHPDIDPVVVVTGQHREMLDQVNQLFGIVPDHDLDLMVHGATLADLSSRALRDVSELLTQERPDAVVVQGDTSTAFIAALAAFYLGIPVVHLEAGLRSGDISSPFPEEANRRLVAPIARLHLAPTSTSRGNLLAEGVDPAIVATTGNTVIDALQEALLTPARFSDPAVERLVHTERRFVLVTAHRRESWGEPMREAMLALRDIAEAEPDLFFVVPMHRNPIVREVVRDVLGDLPQVLLTEPFDYHEFCHTMRAADLVISDSGGVQEEAPSLGKPVLVMRENTERPEAVHAGTVRLVGTDRATIRESALTLLRDPAAYAAMANAVNPYGDGKAGPRAVAAIAHLLEVGHRLPDFHPHSN